MIPRSLQGRAGHLRLGHKPQTDMKAAAHELCTQDNPIFWLGTFLGEVPGSRPAAIQRV